MDTLLLTQKLTQTDGSPMNEQVAPNGLIFLSHKHYPFETASLPSLTLLQKALQHFQWKPVFWQNRELTFFFFYYICCWTAT